MEAEAAVPVPFRDRTGGWQGEHTCLPIPSPHTTFFTSLGYTGLISSDLKNVDTSWLDNLLTPVRLPSIQAIPCAP